ncbi:unnamed protein product [Lymnaea stagnalis]|uniref:Peptidase S1 domain-containing protein n=1 Tax=Lymnaea stagnalis TaxID=6523 RepID=A0AAV2HJZ0_LYMST
MDVLLQVMLLMFSVSTRGQNKSCRRSLIPRPDVSDLKSTFMSYWGTYHPPPFNVPELEAISAQFKNLTCGTMDYDPAKAIINGTIVPEKGWPWHVTIFGVYKYGRGTPFCGAILISRFLAITAAHCKDSFAYAKLGVSEQCSFAPCQQFRRLGGRYKSHTNYSQTVNSARDDIALLDLSEKANFNQYVRPVCLPWTDVTHMDNCYIVGFGYDTLVDADNRSRKLLQAKVRWVQQDVCRTYGRINKMSLDTRVECFQCVDPGVFPCAGDAGSGVYCKDKGYWTLVGIVSERVNKCDESPTFHVDVFMYMKWILDNAIDLLQGRAP